MKRIDVPAARVLEIATGKVCFIIVKAREFDVQDVVTDPDSGSNATDDGMVSVLEGHANNPTYRELTAFIEALDEDEQIELVTLLRLGRGDGAPDDWASLRDEAARQHNTRTTAAYLLGIPLLADHLEEGLSLLGHSCEDFERGHL
jgi:Protein of unknown function (DUF3775)